MGAEAIRKLLQQLDLVKLSDELREELDETGSKQKAKDLINRLKTSKRSATRTTSRSGWCST